MISAMFQYFWDEAIPRLFKIFISSEFIISALLAACAGIWGSGFGLADAKVVDATTALLTYAAIAFGFCLSGLTLVLVLPDLAFANQLARSQINQDAPNAYSNLMFVFSWTAMIHWFAVVGAVAVFAFCGSDQKILPIGAGTSRRAVVGLLTFLTIYGVSNFLVALITLSQVGRLYILKLTKRANPA
jgi:hypothetical protein